MEALICQSCGDNAIFHYPGDRVIAVSEEMLCYVVESLLISSVTNGMPSSVWSVWFFMYQAALTSAVSVLD